MFIAKILGVTSENITIINVIKIVATETPKPPNSETSNSVIKAVAKILNRLLASKIPVINSSLNSLIFKMKFAFLAPLSFCLCARCFDTAVKAVSEPEERADNKSKIIIAKIFIITIKVIILFDLE